MRNVIFIITGLGIGLVVSFYYLSHSLNSLSAEPPPLTIDHLLSLTTFEQVQEIHDAKLTELANILHSITDGQSAREHLPAAQRSYIEWGMINSRIYMLPPQIHDKLNSRTMLAEPMSKLLAECERLQKSPTTAHELRSILAPLSLYQTLLKAYHRSLANPKPATRPGIGLPL